MPLNNYRSSLSFAGTTTEGNRGLEGQKLETWALRHSEEALGSEESDVSFQAAVSPSRQLCRCQWAARNREPRPAFNLTHNAVAGSKRHKTLFLGDLKQNRAGVSAGLNKPWPKEGYHTLQTQKCKTVVCWEQPFILESTFLISLFLWLNLIMAVVVFFTVHTEWPSKK